MGIPNITHIILFHVRASDNRRHSVNTCRISPSYTWTSASGSFIPCNEQCGVLGFESATPKYLRDKQAKILIPLGDALGENAARTSQAGRVTRIMTAIA